MEQRVKKLWIEALRSGKYKQGRKRLRTNDKFCCLGVLCDLYRQEKGGRWRRGADRIFTFLKVSDVLPSEVVKWAGLNGGNPALPDTTANLATMNDAGNNFNFIAGKIEAYL